MLQEYFQGIGGVVGALLAWTGESGCRAAAGGAGVSLDRNAHAHPPHAPPPPAFQRFSLPPPRPVSDAGTRLPGGDSAVAEGNTLGKGPMLFHLPQSMVASLQAQVRD